jgi:hypothetical protein
MCNIVHELLGIVHYIVASRVDRRQQAFPVSVHSISHAATQRLMATDNEEADKPDVICLAVLGNQLQCASEGEQRVALVVLRLRKLLHQHAHLPHRTSLVMHMITASKSTHGLHLPDIAYVQAWCIVNVAITSPQQPLRQCCWLHYHVHLRCTNRHAGHN